MDFGLTDDQRQIQRTARELLSDRARPERVRRHAEEGSVDEELWEELCGLGWPGIAVHEEYGGQGLGRVELSILCEELGYTVAPLPFLPTVLASTLIEQAGSEEQRRRWLPQLARGESIGAVGVVRTAGVAGVAGATGIGESIEATGVVGAAQSVGIIGAAEGGVAELVLGVGGPEDKPQVLVLIEGEGARILTPQEAEVTPTPSIDPTRPAARVRVPPGAGEVLAGPISPGVDRGLVAISSELVGVCERALELTVSYVKERRQFGVPVGAYQAVSHRCAQMLLDTERSRSTTALASWSADSDPERLGEAAAMAKACASDAGREVCASAIQAHGGIGFTWEADLHWLYKRAQLDASLLGGSKHHRARLAAILAGRVGAPVGA
jgi:alkylation response protein AidB-like acyl-CoA dehydrogenase